MENEKKRRRERVYRQQSCRVLPRFLTIAKTEVEKKGTHRVKGEKKTVLRDPECQRHGGLAKQKGHRPRNKPET
jgi:hypothetical protein